jgi:hypothetical protein
MRLFRTCTTSLSLKISIEPFYNHNITTPLKLMVGLSGSKVLERFNDRWIDSPPGSRLHPCQFAAICLHCDSAGMCKTSLSNVRTRCSVLLRFFMLEISLDCLFENLQCWVNYDYTDIRLLQALFYCKSKCIWQLWTKEEPRITLLMTNGTGSNTETL